MPSKKYYNKGWVKHSEGSGTYKHPKKYLGYNYVVVKSELGESVNICQWYLLKFTE